MSDSSNAKDVLHELPLNDLYKDVAHPALSAVGQTISLPFRAVNVLLTPFIKWVIQGEERLNEISNAVAEKVSSVPKENLTEPEPYVAIPALQAISYSMDNQKLKDLYSNLLAKAITKTTKESVHPAFIEIIKQMSPLDAQLMSYIFNQSQSIPMICIRIQKKSVAPIQDLPSFRYMNSGFTVYENYVLGFMENIYPRVSVSIENLNRLGLVRIDNTYKLDSSLYQVFEQSECKKQFETMYSSRTNSNETEVAFLPSTAMITELGKSFSRICISKLI